VAVPVAMTVYSAWLRAVQFPLMTSGVPWISMLASGTVSVRVVPVEMPSTSNASNLVASPEPAMRNSESSGCTLKFRTGTMPAGYQKSEAVQSRRGGRRWRLKARCRSYGVA